MTAIVSFFMLFKLFDLLRLFDSTSFYVHLILETLKDISAFLLLLFLSLVMFGIPLMILNMNRSGDDDLVVEELFSFLPINMLINQYLMALGEFSIDNFAN